MHQCFVVREAGREWLMDAGFGGPGALEPLALDEEEPQSVANGTYRVRFDTAFDETVIERAQADGWHALFGFDRDPVRPIDLDAANHLAATWDGAPFSTHLMMAMQSEGTRSTLFNRKWRRGAGHPPRILADAGERAHALESGFGIVLSGEAELARIWDRIKDAPAERRS